MCLLKVWDFLSIHVFSQAFMRALPILKVSARSGAKSSLYGFLPVVFSHGFTALPNSRLFCCFALLLRTTRLTSEPLTLAGGPFYFWPAYLWKATSSFALSPVPVIFLFCAMPWFHFVLPEGVTPLWHNPLFFSQKVKSETKQTIL